MKKCLFIIFSFMMIVSNLFIGQCLAGNYSGYTIGIDPGHGGSDPGALGYNGSSYPDEADINLDIALKLKSSLAGQGANVGISRSSDSYLSLSSRVNYINNLNPDAFISIHCNSFSDSSAHGTETYWHSYGTTADKTFATAIQNKMVSAFGTTNRGVKQDQFYVLSVSSSIPAILAEMLFISNQSEFNYITTSSGKQTAVTAFDNGIKEFLNISGDTGKPDLVPYKRSGWDNTLVVSNQEDTTTTASKIYDDENIYVDYSCKNAGTQDAGAFKYGLYIDGVRKKYVSKDSLAAGYHNYILDSSLGKLSSGNHTFEIRCDDENQVSESNESNNKYSRSVYISQRLVKPLLNSFSINNNAASTTSQTVTLNNSATNNPTHYMACEKSSFSGASWLSYSAYPKFTLSSSYGNKTVYFKVKNSAGESNVISDLISYKDEGGECHNMDWTPVVYTNSTTAYGVVTIDGIPASEGDIVAAFVGEECRAVNSVVLYNGKAYVTLVIQGEIKENVSLKIGDMSECTVYNVNQRIQTNPGNSIGSPPNYLQIQYTPFVDQTIHLNTGWNLISMYVMQDDMSPASVFESIMSEIVQVKSTSETYDPNLPDFLNTLKTLTEGYGYWIKVNDQVQLNVSGKPIDTVSIQLNEGWNLVAYPYQQSQPVVQALEGIDSGLLQLKSTDKTYDPNLPDFLNTLKNFESGEGYWIKVSKATLLNFPQPVNTKSKSGNRGNQSSQVVPDWKVVTYTNSTTAYGIVTNGASSASEGDIVGAFVGNECRASGNVVISEGNAYITLIIQGETIENVNFKLYDVSKDMVLDIQNTYQTDPGSTIGQPPNFLNLTTAHSISGDFNSDGSVDLRDAILVLKVTCDISLTEKLFLSADVNNDGVIDIMDSIYIVQKVIK